MKKKKLKKKIKKLERDIKRIAGFQRDLALRESNNANHIKSCKDVITKLENDICKLKDSKGCKDDIKKLSNRIDDILLSTNYLINSVKRIDTRCDVLDRRTQIDYDKIIPKTEETKNEEKTCDTCKWKPLMEQGGQDIPCIGCTADDKKMWKSKEA